MKKRKKQTERDYKEEKQKNEKNFENIHPTTDRLYVRDIEMNAYIDALSKVIIILNEAYKDLRMAYITINTNAFF